MSERGMRAMAIMVAGLGVVVTGTAAGQSVQYRSPAGVAYRSQADTGAIARAEQALAANPGSVERMIDLGNAQSGVRQFREAIATFSRAIELAPNNAVLYRWRGHRYLSVRELDRALADLNKGASLDSSVYGIWYHLGIVRFVLGEFSAAAEAFAQGLPMAPNAGERAGSFDWQWMALQRAGRAEDARALLAAMPDSVPRVAANAYGQRLRLYQGVIGPDQVSTPADTGDVSVATIAYGVGNWHLVRGDSTRAREWFLRSIESGGWPAFGFIASEAELRRLR